MALHGGRFCLSSTPGPWHNVWRQFWVSQFGGCYWNLVGYVTSSHARDSPHSKNHPAPNVTSAPELRNPASDNAISRKLKDRLTKLYVV